MFPLEKWNTYFLFAFRVVGGELGSRHQALLHLLRTMQSRYSYCHGPWGICHRWYYCNFFDMQQILRLNCFYPWSRIFCREERLYIGVDSILMLGFGLAQWTVIGSLRLLHSKLFVIKSNSLWERSLSKDISAVDGTLLLFWASDNQATNDPLANWLTATSLWERFYSPHD